MLHRRDSRDLRRAGALRGWMEGYMDAMQTAVYALAAVGGVCALRKKEARRC